MEAHGSTKTTRLGVVDSVLPQRQAVRGEVPTARRKASRSSCLKSREGAGVHGLAVTPTITRLRFEQLAHDLELEYQGERSAVCSHHLKRRITQAPAAAFGGRRMAAVKTSDIREFIAQRQAAGASKCGDQSRARRVEADVLAGGEGREVALSSAYPDARRAECAIRDSSSAISSTSVRAQLPDDLKHVATFAFYTGWRVASEILPLQWRQIDFGARGDAARTGHDEE